MYLLDTNIVSYWMRGDRKVIAAIRQQSPSKLSLSAVTLAEIYYGIEKSPHKKRERRLKIDRIRDELTLFSFNEQAAASYGAIRANLEKQGCSISERDTQIAAVAVANGLCLVTNNAKEFSRVKGLLVENWTAG